jgi:imidazolonepropionase-like amidohydrolase
MPNIGADSGSANFAGQAAFLSLGVKPEIAPKIGIVWGMRRGAPARGAAFVQLKAELGDVRRYAKDRSALSKGELTARDWSVVDLDALVAVIEGKQRLVTRVDRASDILALLSLARQEKIKLVLVGAAEGWRVAEQIAEAGVPVMLNPTNNLPGNFDEVGAIDENAARLFSAGVKIVLRGGSSAHDAGKLRYFAGMAVARGLPYQAALQAVTVTPARIWGANHFGAIAVGQRADLAIWNGDPFEPLTELIALYIKGEPQALASRQDQLEAEYIKAARSSSSSTANNIGN